MFDPAAIRDLLEPAGTIAMKHFRRVRPTWKENRTWVTDADLEVQNHLRSRLEQEYPEDGIVAEEDGLRKPPAAGRRRWIIDPIDGTASFVSGLPVWGIALALVEGGEPIGGALLMPATGDLYCTGEGADVLRNGEPTAIKAPQPLHRETTLLTTSRFHRGFHVDDGFRGKIRCLGSTVAHLVFAATGSADAAIAGRCHVWDIAPGLAMLSRAGGELRYFSGEPVSLAPLLSGENAPEPMIGGHPETVARFLGALSRRGG